MYVFCGNYASCNSYEGIIHKLLLISFYAQLTIPFFMVIPGFTFTLSYEKHENWYSLSNMWRKVKRFIFPLIPALILEIITAFILQCIYEVFTHLVDLDVQIYRLLIFWYFIFLYIGIVLYKAQTKNEICWKSMLKLLPLEVLYIFLVGYMNQRPEILFRYPTWYHSAAPVIF